MMAEEVSVSVEGDTVIISDEMFQQLCGSVRILLEQQEGEPRGGITLRIQVVEGGGQGTTIQVTLPVRLFAVLSQTKTPSEGVIEEISGETLVEPEHARGLQQGPPPQQPELDNAFNQRITELSTVVAPLNDNDMREALETLVLARVADKETYHAQLGG